MVSLDYVFHALSVAIPQFIGLIYFPDIDAKDSLTNGFALFAYMGIVMLWGSIQTMTIELYPTVIR